MNTNKKIKTEDNSLSNRLDLYLNGKLPLENLYVNNNRNSSEIKSLKEIYSFQLKEIEKLNKLLDEKDNQILTLKGENTTKPTNSKISAMTKKIKNLESGNKSDKNLNIQEMKSEYVKEINSMKEEHEQKIEELKTEIKELKSKISVFEKKEEDLPLDEYQIILDGIKTKHKKEIEPEEKEIADLEKYINDNYPGALTEDEFEFNTEKYVIHGIGYEDNKKNNNKEEIRKTEDFFNMDSLKPKGLKAKYKLKK